jgi:hypothetical protein
MNDIHDIALFKSVINLDLHNRGGGNLTMEFINICFRGVITVSKAKVSFACTLSPKLPAISGGGFN